MLTLTDTKTKQSFTVQPGVNSFPFGFLRENGHYRFEARGRAGSELRLFVSHEELECTYRQPSSIETLCHWDWNIEFYAGEVIILFTEDDQPSVDALLDVAPNRNKLGVEVYHELIADLQSIVEGLVFGSTPAHARLQHKRAEVPNLAKLAMLRVYFDKLERAFRRIEETPHRRLIAEREERSLHRVRQVDSRSLQTALKRMPVLAALKQKNSSDLATIAKLNVPKREHTYDTSPNRHVTSLLVRLSSLCTDLHQIFIASQADNDYEFDVQRKAERNAVYCARLNKRLRRMSRSDFLSGINPARPDTAALLTIARQPAYAQFDNVARHILEPKLSLGEDADKLLSLRQTFDIYEYWCFFQVLNATKTALPELDWQDAVDVVSEDLLLNLKNGSSIHGASGDISVTVTFQRHYGSKKNGQKLFSISRQCYPDVVLEVEKGEKIRTVIFDPKYRSSTDSIHAGLSDMHVYRDAIRDANTLKPGIHAAYILTPNHFVETNRYYTDEYHSMHHFGAFDLSPGIPEQFSRIATEIRRHVEEVQH